MSGAFPPHFLPSVRQLWDIPRLYLALQEGNPKQRELPNRESKLIGSFRQASRSNEKSWGVTSSFSPLIGQAPAGCISGVQWGLGVYQRDGPFACSLNRAPLHWSLLAGGRNSPQLLFALRYFCFPYLLP